MVFISFFIYIYNILITFSYFKQIRSDVNNLYTPDRYNTIPNIQIYIL